MKNEIIYVRGGNLEKDTDDYEILERTSKQLYSSDNETIFSKITVFIYKIRMKL